MTHSRAAPHVSQERPPSGGLFVWPLLCRNEQAPVLTRHSSFMSQIDSYAPMLWGRNLKDTKFYTMPLDDLWKLHEEVISALTSRVEAKKMELEKRLEQLGTRFGGSPRDLPKARPYPRVAAKFRNPESSAETWSGRGKQPHWVQLLLAKGGSLEDCRIQ